MKIAAKTNGKFAPGKALKDLTAKPVKAAKVPAKKK
jgi:nucleoid DNA-binding protein